MWPCSSLRTNNGLPRSIMSFFFFPNNVLGLLMRESWLELVCPCLRANSGCLRSIINIETWHRHGRGIIFSILSSLTWCCCRWWRRRAWRRYRTMPLLSWRCHWSWIRWFLSFPLLRRSSFVIIPSWVACWVRAFNKFLVMMARRGSWVAAHNGLLRSIIFLSFRTPGTQTPIAFLFRAFWRRRWQSWGSPCNKTHHRLRFCCDSFFPWILLRSFCHPFRTYCRTEMANVEQTQKIIPFVTCEIALG